MCDKQLFFKSLQLLKRSGDPMIKVSSRDLVECIVSLIESHDCEQQAHIRLLSSRSKKKAGAQNTPQHHLT